jgi:hypothetical protein
MGCYRFGVPRDLVLWLKEAFALQHFIETGTNRGETAAWASGHFNQVTTIEGSPLLFDAARKEYGRVRNIEFLLGDSRAHLRRLVPQLSGPAIFWLDAHWCGTDTFGQADECPVLGEVHPINASPHGHFVLIDDARYFLAPPPAPHDADHWPDIWQVCSQLKKHVSDRHVVVHEDVIIAVPHSAKRELTQYLRVLRGTEAPTVFEPSGRSFLGKLKMMWARH